MMFVSFKSNTAAVTNGVRTANPSIASAPTSYVCGGFVLLNHYVSVLCILDHRLSFFLVAIALSVLRSSTSDNPFGIFKFF